MCMSWYLLWIIHNYVLSCFKRPISIPIFYIHSVQYGSLCDRDKRNAHILSFHFNLLRKIRSYVCGCIMYTCITFKYTHVSFLSCTYCSFFIHVILKRFFIQREHYIKSFFNFVSSSKNVRKNRVSDSNIANNLKLFENGAKIFDIVQWYFFHLNSQKSVIIKSVNIMRS